MSLAGRPWNFVSEEWLQLDEGIINEQQAEEIFKEKVPENLESQVKEIMDSWFEQVEFYQEVCSFIRELKGKGFGVYGLSNTNIQFYE